VLEEKAEGRSVAQREIVAARPVMLDRNLLDASSLDRLSAPTSSEGSGNFARNLIVEEHILNTFKSDLGDQLPEG
jgi:hypothetical protein